MPMPPISEMAPHYGVTLRVAVPVMVVMMQMARQQQQQFQYQYQYEAPPQQAQPAERPGQGFFG